MNYEINKYPDGTSYVTIPREWEDTFQEITFKINTYESLIHLMQLCEVLEYKSVNATITIPNLIDAQADRRFASNQSSFLYKIARIFNDHENIFLRIFHPHNPEVVEALFDNVEIIGNSRFIMQVIYDGNNGIAKDLGTNEEIQNNLILMSSDAGGFKPLMKLCDKINWKGETASANKSRSHIDGETRLVQGLDRDDYNGKDILIVDDISVYGGTFKGLAKLLRECNCGKLYLAVSHITVQNLGEDPVTNYFDKVFTTNSKFDKHHKYEDSNNPLAGSFTPENLEVIKLF